MTLEEKIEELIEHCDIEIIPHSDICRWCGRRDIASIHTTKQAILALIKDETVKARVEELERIDKANKDNGICFWFEDMKPQNNGWRNMRQYVPERIAQL